jgi:hypothetical protein
MSESTIPDLNAPLHVIPAENTDLVRHTLADDCVCGPDMEPVKRDDGSVGWICTHHSLDGRERGPSGGAQ